MSLAINTCSCLSTIGRRAFCVAGPVDDLRDTTQSMISSVLRLNCIIHTLVYKSVSWLEQELSC